MLSDFFLPSIGGVELHIYALATRLRARGHKVVVFTHAQPGRVGVRWITGGIKVYHAPRVVMYDNCTFPNFFGAFKLFRKVRALDLARSDRSIDCVIRFCRRRERATDADNDARRCAYERASPSCTRIKGAPCRTREYSTRARWG